MKREQRFTKGLSRRYYPARARKRPEGPVRRGSLEVCTTTRLIGWAIEDDQPGVLEVFVGHERVAGIRCDRLRPDLAGIGARTDAGFEFAFDRPIAASQPVRVCFADGTLLENAPAIPTRYESSVDVCTTERVSGWAICDGQPAEIEIFVNGGLTARLHCIGPRPDLAGAGIAPNSGFEFAFPVAVTEADEISVRFPDGTQLAGSPRRPHGAEVQPISGAAAHELRDRSVDREAEFARSLLSSDFVDNELFQRAVGGSKDDLAAVRLFLTLPSDFRPDVSWFLDRKFYFDTYPDVARANAGPLLHFIQFGIKELRNPHPLIDLNYIRQHRPDLLPVAPNVDDLIAVLRNDAVDPSKYFSLAYYKSQIEHEEPPPHGLLFHFLSDGIFRGLKPVPGFEPIADYREVGERNSDFRAGLRAFVRRGEHAETELAGLGDASVLTEIQGLEAASLSEIHLYCLAWNEAKLLPQFLRHYTNLVDRFFVFDNGSTDATLSLLAADDRILVTHFDQVGDSFVEQERRMSDTIWQYSRGRARWVIIVDIDEFLYHADLRAYLDDCAAQAITAVEAIGYQMVADVFPPSDRPLTATVTCGVRDMFYDKLVIFDPNAIIGTNYRRGRHTAVPTGRVAWPARKAVTLLHYKRLGGDYVVERNAELKPGLRSRDVDNRWGTQYLMTRTEVERDWRKFSRDAAPVPGLATDGELELCLVADGQRVQPTEAAHNRFTFHLPPPGARRLRLISERAGPVRRPCGVPVSRIFIRGENRVVAVAPDDPTLTEGWLEMDTTPADPARWTSSDATIPVSASLGTPLALEVTLCWPLAGQTHPVLSTPQDAGAFAVPHPPEPVGSAHRMPNPVTRVTDDPMLEKSRLEAAMREWPNDVPLRDEYFKCLRRLCRSHFGAIYASLPEIRTPLMLRGGTHISEPSSRWRMTLAERCGFV